MTENRRRHISECFDIMSAAEYLQYYNADKKKEKQITRQTLWRRTRDSMLPTSVIAKKISKSAYVYLLFNESIKLQP